MIPLFTGAVIYPSSGGLCCRDCRAGVVYGTLPVLRLIGSAWLLLHPATQGKYYDVYHDGH